MKLALLLTALVGVASSARILAVLPFFGKSHHIFYSSILHTLLQKGHEVVEYGPHPPKEKIPNYTHVEVHTKFETIFKTWTYEDYLKLFDDFSYFGQGTTNIWQFCYQICNETFEHENIKKLLKSKEHFDLVLTTSTFGQESMVVFGHKFNAPTITLQGFAYSSVLNNPSGNVLSMSVIPDTMSFPFSSKMTFLEKFRNALSVTLSLYKYYNYHLPNQDDLIRHHYKVANVPTVAEMIKNISLTFVNSHPAVEYAIPYTPNIVPIAGINIVPDRKPLPDDVKKFMNEAKDGVIYFSLGSNIPMHVFPKELLQRFINVFKKLPQRVLWKIDTEDLPGIPQNVKVMKWVPQLGVLEHPNLKLFITHGGLFSQQEAIHAGVPTIGIPFFADQPYNIKFYEVQGIGIGLSLKTLTEDSFHSAILTVLSDPKYRENAQRLSRIFRDRPVSAADSVVFWVEYVLRHAGAHHLRPASTELTWYQLALLDVLAIVLLPFIIGLLVLYLVMKKMMSFIFKKGKPTKVGKSKKNK